jgi:hypothetical protein
VVAKSILSRIFGGSERSRLAKLLDGITPESIPRTARTQKDTEMRVATLISLTVLRIAADFARDVEKTIETFVVQTNARHRSQGVLSITVFECAAFCHYTLMAPYLRVAEDDEELDDAEINDDDPFLNVLGTAAHLSDGLITSHCDFDGTEKFFLNRMLSYDLEATRKEDVFGQFQAVLTASIDAGSPHASRPDRPSLDLALNLGLAATVVPFCTTMLPALQEVARNAYDHADELGFLA